jgi:peptidoglycan/xylan/chitin deacetylase (PgdA/CDA1 family)
MLQRLFQVLCQKVVLRFNSARHGGVLYFHRVLPFPDPYYPDDLTVNELDTLLHWLGQAFEFSRLSDMKNPPSGDKPRLGLSFDDGYQDNLRLGVPVLLKHGVPATFFVASRGVKEGILWQDRLIHAIKHASSARQLHLCRRERIEPTEGCLLATRLLSILKRMPHQERDRATQSICIALDAPAFPWLMLTQQDIQTLGNDESGLFDIGGHTCDHTVLTTESDTESKRQIVHNKKELESWLGKPITLFCYPNGAVPTDLTALHAEMVKEAGYTMAFTSMDGGVGIDSHDYLLPRFLPHRKHPWLRTLSALKIAGESSL